MDQLLLQTVRGLSLNGSDRPALYPSYCRGVQACETFECAGQRPPTMRSCWNLKSFIDECLAIFDQVFRRNLDVSPVTGSIQSLMRTLIGALGKDITASDSDPRTHKRGVLDCRPGDSHYAGWQCNERDS